MRPLMRFAALIVIFASGGCDGYTRLSGHVLDPVGVPIADATVSLAEADNLDERNESMTGADGAFSVDLTHAPMTFPLVLSVSKPGYHTHRKEITSGITDRNHKVVLNPE